MSTIKASVQYGDWEGTAAADDSDGAKIRDFLKSQKLMKDDEFVVAVEISIAENHGGKVQPPYIEALLFHKADYDTATAAINSMVDPLPMRKVRVELTLDQFIGLFKRFAVTFSRTGLGLTGREYKA